MNVRIRSLIVVQVLPDERRDRRRDRDEADDHLPRQPREVEHVEARCADQQRGAQIGLALDQIHGYRDQHRGEQEILPADTTPNFWKYQASISGSAIFMSSEG